MQKHSKNQYLKEIPTPKKVIREKRKRSLNSLFLIVITIIGLFGLGNQIWNNVQNIQVLKQEIVKAEEQLEGVQQEQAILEEEIALINDEKYVADFARSEYLLTRDNEIVFNFIDPKEKDAEEKIAKPTDNKENTE